MIDELIDLGTSKYLVYVVRFLNPKLEVKDGTHSGLFPLIVEYFNKMNILYKEKMVGMIETMNFNSKSQKYTLFMDK